MPGTEGTMDIEGMEEGTMGMEATTDTGDTTGTDGMAIPSSILTPIIRTLTRTHHMRIRRIPPNPSTPVYIEPEQPFYWYYCQDPQGYYPYVESCPSGWMRVVPTPRRVAQSPPARPTRSTVLQPIYFDLNKSDIRPDAARTLNENLRMVPSESREEGKYPG